MPVDMAPEHAAALEGFANFVSNCASLMAPLTVGYIIDDVVSISKIAIWRTNKK